MSAAPKQHTRAWSKRDRVWVAVIFDGYALSAEADFGLAIDRYSA